MSSMYIRWLIFSCNLLSLYPAMHFLSLPIYRLNVRSCVSWSISLSPSPYIWVLSVSILRRVQGILQRGLSRYLFLWFLQQNLVSRSFIVLLRYSFCTFSFIFVCLMVSAPNIPRYLWFIISLLVSFLHQRQLDSHWTLLRSPGLFSVF